MKYTAQGYQKCVDVKDEMFTNLLKIPVEEWEGSPEFEAFCKARDDADAYYRLWMWENSACHSHCGSFAP